MGTGQRHRPVKPPLILLEIYYQAMRAMYLTEPMSFDEILATLAELEKRVNGISGG